VRKRLFNKIRNQVRMGSGWLQPTLAHLGIEAWTWKQCKAYRTLQQDTPRRTVKQDKEYEKLRVQARKFRKLRRKAAKKLGVPSRPCFGTISFLYVYLASLKRLRYI